MAIDKNIPDQGVDEAKLEKEVFSEEVELEAQEPEEAPNVEMFEDGGAVVNFWRTSTTTNAARSRC